MKEMFEQVIQLGNYDLAQLLSTIDRYHIEGKLTDEERQELYMSARRGAEPGYDYAGEIDAPPEEQWPEFVQPTGAGTAYQIGDKITFHNEHYICVLAHCVWSPADYPSGWEKQEQG